MRLRSLRAAAAVLALAASTACYETPKPACAFLCGPSEACPEDYRCADDGWCKRNDVPRVFECPDERAPDAAVPVDASAIDAGIDATPPDAAPPDAAP